jgi:hypothetical protein
MSLKRPRGMAATLTVAALALALSAAVAGACMLKPDSGASAKFDVGATAAKSSTLPSRLAAARLATSKYVTNLNKAKADGYGILTRMIPTMGWHFVNPKITGAFDVRKPPILVYEKRGGHWQLGALEWTFPTKPGKPPLPGAKYGSFPAACHYKDGTFVEAPAESACAPKSPKSGAAFNFWHGPLVTMHVWLWYPNPSGLYASMNPLVKPFNHG